MQVIDLTHVITPDMPVYPGTGGPRFEAANSYEKDGFKETLMHLYTHTGTHMDPPAHLYEGAKTLDAFPAGQFAGTAAVIDCTELGEGDRITMAHINRRREAAGAAEFLLFHTGWDRYWGDARYFGDYPCIDREVAQYLVESGKKGIGLDTIGLDPIADANLTLHKIVLAGGGTVIIENLTNLALVGEGLVTFCALPLKCVDADGSPVRAVVLK
jgi:kynurenine formamidase